MPSCPANLYPCKPLDQPHLQLASKLHPNAPNLLKKRSFQSLLKAWFPKIQTKWALNNLKAWMKARNMSYPHDPVQEDILLNSDLNLHISRFVHCMYVYWFMHTFCVLFNDVAWEDKLWLIFPLYLRKGNYKWAHLALLWKDRRWDILCFVVSCVV